MPTTRFALLFSSIVLLAAFARGDDPVAAGMLPVVLTLCWVVSRER